MYSKTIRRSLQNKVKNPSVRWYRQLFLNTVLFYMWNFNSLYYDDKRFLHICQVIFKKKIIFLHKIAIFPYLSHKLWLYITNIFFAVSFSSFRKYISSDAIICNNKRKIFYVKFFDRFTAQIFKSNYFTFFYTMCS